MLPIKKQLASYVRNIIKAKNISFDVTILDNEEAKYESFVVADYAIATSGTVALELSYFNIAYLVAYKFNFFSYAIIKSLAQTKFANLINIINNQGDIPELLQTQCTADKIGKKLEKIISDDEYKKSILHASEVAIAQLNCKENPSSLAAKEVIHMLKNGK